LRSPALISTCPKAECHAVLAFLSERYPPLEGRSPTRYSPVCHSTQGRSPFRVRLACIRHAASVDSEPGSNSHVKVVRSDFPCESPEQAFNTRPRRPTARIALIGSCAVQKRLTMDGSQRLSCQLAPAGFAPCHPLILRRVYFACTFYLVFKEPFTANFVHRSTPRWPSLGEPSKTTLLFASCQPFSYSLSKFFLRPLV
jgi:hypothetical protein